SIHQWVRSAQHMSDIRDPVVCLKLAEFEWGREMEKKRLTVLQFEELKDEARKLMAKRKEFEDRRELQAVAAHAAEVARVTEDSPVAMPPPDVVPEPILLDGCSGDDS
ncbi:unnamed protein product, partial [Pylaiella littoralis]